VISSTGPCKLAMSVSGAVIESDALALETKPKRKLPPMAKPRIFAEVTEPPSLTLNG
jgi:hypothetical protein